MLLRFALESFLGRRILIEVFEWAKKNSTTYDAEVGVSGGKDSTYLAINAKERFGLNCLLVNTTPDAITELGQYNLDNLRQQGFDLMMFRPNPKICKAVAKRAFYEYGNPIKPSEYPLNTVAVRLAINLKIPLLIWGENPALELGDDPRVAAAGGDASYKMLKNTQRGCNASDWVKDDITKKDVIMYQHPTREEILAAGTKCVYMGYYLKECSLYNNAQFSIERGFKGRTGDLHDLGRYRRYTACDDDTTMVNQLLKYIKLGFGYATVEACYDISEKRLTRDEGLEKVKEYDGKCGDQFIKEFCDYIDITVDEFWRVANSWRGPMWKKEKGEWKLTVPIGGQEEVIGSSKRRK